jgi:aldehyde:ferredoxin oxidoreductase
VLWNKEANPEYGFGKMPEDVYKRAQEWAKKKFGSEEALVPTAYEGKARALKWDMEVNCISDSLGMCLNMSRPGGPSGVPGTTFSGDKSFDFLAQRFTAVTGIPMDEAGLFKAAERVINVERSFIVRDGRSRVTDTIPDFFFDVGVPDGPLKGTKLDRAKFEKMKTEYYEARGWNVETGWPTRAKLEELGLKDIADDLEKHGKLGKAAKTEVAKKD